MHCTVIIPFSFPLLLFTINIIHKFSEFHSIQYAIEYFHVNPFLNYNSIGCSRSYYTYSLLLLRTTATATTATATATTVTT